MRTLADLELVLSPSERMVTLPLHVIAPVWRGSVDAWLAREPGGEPAHPTLRRTLIVPAGGVVPPLQLLTRDVRDAWPKGGKAWLIVAYAGTPMARAAVRVVAG